MSAARRLRSLAALVLFLACADPAIEGGQIADPPPGFAYDPNCGAARLVFPERSLVRQRCWYEPRKDSPDWLTVSEFRGPSSEAEIETARAAHSRSGGLVRPSASGAPHTPGAAAELRSLATPEARYGADEYGGPLERLTIDGREAFAWSGEQEYQGQVVSRSYTAVVSYPDATFTVEFSGRSARYLEVAALRDTVASFRVVRRGDIDLAKLLALLGAALGIALAVRWARGLSREKKPRRVLPPRPPPARPPSPPPAG